MSSVVDLPENEWVVKKQQYKERLSSIMIPLDPTPGIAKGLLSRIDNLFSELRLEVAEGEGKKETIDSIIREWERSKATGSNDTERKRNATEALQNYPVDDVGTVNLYHIQRQVSERLSYLQGLLDIINGKQSRLITLTGVLKLEKDLSPYTDIN